MTLCCQLTNYAISALEREEIHTTYTGSNNFNDSDDQAKNMPAQVGNRSPLDAYLPG